MPNTIGKIVKVNLREIWKHEAQDFTIWLSKNIEYLNEVIASDITVQTTEGNVGPFRVDIYGEDSSGNKVIIENQLEKTDHAHLGQLLTYLVNLEANIAIWISANPVEEHRQVVEWLNETTPEGMYFYLIKVEGVKIDGQDRVAPLFTVVEGPTIERKKIGSEKKEFARRHGVRERFWAQLIGEMNKHNNLCEHLSPGKDQWIGISLGVTGISLNLVATGDYVRAEIYINRGDRDENKRIFDFFLASKNEIEKAFGGPLVWERMDDRVTSRVKSELAEVDIFDESNWAKMNSFLIDVTPRLHASFREPIQRLRSKANRD